MHKVLMAALAAMGLLVGLRGRSDPVPVIQNGIRVQHFATPTPRPTATTPSSVVEYTPTPITIVVTSDRPGYPVTREPTPVTIVVTSDRPGYPVTLDPTPTP